MIHMVLHFLYSIHLVWSVVVIAARFIRPLSLISRLISELSQGAEDEFRILFFLNGTRVFAIVRNKCFQDSQASIGSGVQLVWHAKPLRSTENLQGWFSYRSLLSHQMAALRSGRLYKNITQTIINACSDWGDLHRLDRPCSIWATGRRPERSRTILREPLAF